MRNISFAFSPAQIRNRTKTVTRRLGWESLERGELLCACVKCMGLKPGEQIERLCIIQVVDVRRERLSEMDDFASTPSNISSYGDRESIAEGFPGLTGSEFVSMFVTHMKCDVDDEVTRIEFRYVPGGKLESL